MNSGARTLRNVMGSEKGDGYIGPKWLGIKNPFADEQANALNNSSAETVWECLYLLLLLTIIMLLVVVVVLKKLVILHSQVDCKHMHLITVYSQNNNDRTTFL